MNFRQSLAEAAADVTRQIRPRSPNDYSAAPPPASTRSLDTSKRASFTSHSSNEDRISTTSHGSHTSSGRTLSSKSLQSCRNLHEQYLGARAGELGSEDDDNGDSIAEQDPQLHEEEVAAEDRVLKTVEQSEKHVRENSPPETLRFSRRSIEELSLQIANSDAFKATISVPPTAEHTGDICLPLADEDAIPEIFRSLCMCDDKINGLPILTKSKYFRYGPRMLKIGPLIMANLPRAEFEQFGCCHISVHRGRPDSVQKGQPDSTPTFLLEYVALLFECTPDGPMDALYVLVSVFDITAKIAEWAVDILKEDTVARLEYEQALLDQKYAESYEGYYSLARELYTGADNLDESEVHPAFRRQAVEIYDHDAGTEEPPEYDIDWVEAGREEESHEEEERAEQEAEDCSSTWSVPTSDSSFVEPLYKLVQDFRRVHRDSLIFIRSEEAKSWQIGWASYSLTLQPEDLKGGFNAMSLDSKAELNKKLSRERPFSMNIKWGTQGLVKTIYCQPMYRSKFHSWMCFLEDESFPDLWANSSWSQYTTD